MGAVLGLFFRDAGFAIALAGDAAFDAGEGFDSLGRDRLAADFAEDGRLPVVIVGPRRRGSWSTAWSSLFFAERAGHSRGRFDKQPRSRSSLGSGSRREACRRFSGGRSHRRGRRRFATWQFRQMSSKDSTIASIVGSGHVE